jgi:colanic acid/amylovoran biosynthesis glycosyltransferase
MNLLNELAKCCRQQKIIYIHFCRDSLKKCSIRLVFSGYLNKIKGAHALIRIAHILQQRQLPFEFHIFGDGDLEKEMRKTILRLGLEKNVALHGVLNFTDKLIPTLKENIDLFVCCHVQGDPSCT